MPIETNAGPFSIIVEIDVHPARLNDYLELLSELMFHTQHEKNLISFEVHTTPGNPAHLTLVERWCDRTEFDKGHRIADYRRSYDEQSPAMLASPPIVRFLRPVRSWRGASGQVGT